MSLNPPGMFDVPGVVAKGVAGPGSELGMAP
jgi:hypothetical protein